MKLITVAPHDSDTIFQVKASNIKVTQRRQQKSCEVDSSWTIEGIWTTIYTNISYSLATNLLRFKVIVQRSKPGNIFFSKIALFWRKHSLPLKTISISEYILTLSSWP